MLAFPSYRAEDLISFGTQLEKAASDSEARDETGKWTAGSAQESKKLAGLEAEASKLKGEIAKLKSAKMTYGKKTNTSSSAKTPASAGGSSSSGGKSSGASAPTELNKLEAKLKNVEAEIAKVKASA